MSASPRLFGLLAAVAVLGMAFEPAEPSDSTPEPREGAGGAPVRPAKLPTDNARAVSLAEEKRARKAAKRLVQR